MLTPQDVRSVQFEKNLRGYRTEDVDRFLDKIEEQLQQDDAQAEQLRKQIADLTAENQRLHRELQSYEADGEMLKSALINAQRMGENVIREANQKAEEIVARYSGQIRQDDLDDIVDRELKFFILADEDRWGFTVVPVLRREGQLQLGPDQFFRFETEGWVTNFFDGTK